MFDDIKKYILERFFEFSIYDKNHTFYSDKNKKKLDFLKDECASKPIIQFVVLKAKLSSILLNDENKKRAKGCQMAVLKKFKTRSFQKMFK